MAAVYDRSCRGVPSWNHSAQEHVVDLHAAVLDEVEAGGLGEAGGFFVGDTALEPHAFGAGGDGVAGDVGAVLGAAKDVDHVDRAGVGGGGREGGVALQAHHTRVVGVDGDDL